MDENNMSPELTLDAVPTLTLDPAADEAAAAAAAFPPKSRRWWTILPKRST